MTRLACCIVVMSLAGQVALAQRPALPHPFAAAVEAASDMPRLYSLLIQQRGTLVVERYFNGARAARAANVKSVAKSVISALVGIAIANGTIPGTDTPILKYFPEIAQDPERRKRDITIDDLLSMRSGLESTSNRNYGAWVVSRNWVRHALTRPLLSAPGTQMDYSTGNTHLLSAILTRAAGKSTWQYANDVLARPLGFSLARWPQDPQGIYFGGNDMLMTPQQMLAFGTLYLEDGRADGRQLIPAGWIEQSWEPRGRSPISGERYGYGWWIAELAGERAYYAWGFGGQYIFVVPGLDLVVVTTSNPNVGEDRRSHRRNVMDLVDELVVGVAAIAS